MVFRIKNPISGNCVMCGGAVEKGFDGKPGALTCSAVCRAAYSKHRERETAWLLMELVTVLWKERRKKAPAFDPRPLPENPREFRDRFNQAGEWVRSLAPAQAAE
jgi:predicted nucleic acid-binding Zn ribbon protein